MEANFIALLRDGKIIERGTYEQLMAMKGEIANLIRAANNEEMETNESETSSPASDTTVYGTGHSSEVEDVDNIETEEVQVGEATLAPIRTTPRTRERKESGLSLRRASTASFRGPRGKLNDEEAGQKTKQREEFSEQGKVKWNVYAEYAKTSNLSAVAVYLLTLIGAQSAQIGTSTHPR